MGKDHAQARTRRRTRLAAAGLVAVAVAVAAMALPAAAASTARFTGLIPGSTTTVIGSIGGVETGLDAGLMGLTIDGTVAATGYCIDIGTGITVGATLSEEDWDDSGVANLAVVEQVLSAYHPNGSGPAGYAITGTDAQRAAATQAAIWHFSDGFDLSPARNDAVVTANYQAILRAAADGVLPGRGEPGITLAITGPDVPNAHVGQRVGPFVVRTTSGAVTLTAPAGVTVTDAAGAPLAGPIVDGTEFWLAGTPGPGEVTVTASAQAAIHAGRVFARPGLQRLVLAAPVEVEATAQVTASWTQPPTTEPPTTSRRRRRNRRPPSPRPPNPPPRSRRRRNPPPRNRRRPSRRQASPPRRRRRSSRKVSRRWTRSPRPCRGSRACRGREATRVRWPWRPWGCWPSVGHWAGSPGGRAAPERPRTPPGVLPRGPAKLLEPSPK